MLGEVNAAVQFAAREPKMGDARGPDRDLRLARVLEENDTHRCVDRLQIGAPTRTDGPAASFAGGTSFQDGHRVGQRTMGAPNEQAGSPNGTPRRWFDPYANYFGIHGTAAR